VTGSSPSPRVNQDSDRFDLILIGAGINGAGIARDATLRGLRVLLLDKGDVAGGTTSWSTRLIHGGLRYLEHGEIGLVRESLRERERLLRIAPHLVRDHAKVAEVPFGAAFAPAHRAWITKDRTEPGHIGNPAIASAEKGETIFRVFSADVVKFMERVIAWDGKSWEG